MSDMPWIDAYEPRDWRVYRLPAGRNPDGGPKLRAPATTFMVCGAESEYAREHYETHRLYGGSYNLFYFDLEQMAADRPVYGTEGLKELAEPWRDHPEGSLVLVTYEGITEVPPVYTYLVEVSNRS